MPQKKNILAIIGSANANSANLKLIEKIASLTEIEFNLTVFSDLKSLPHFDPELTSDNTPRKIIELRNLIEKADGIIICTPEYVFSIPSGLKNIIEWFISTTIFMDKPCGLITAAAIGEKAHEELQLLMKTAMAKLSEETTILIQGVKGKMDLYGNIKDTETKLKLDNFIKSFKILTSTNQCLN